MKNLCSQWHSQGGFLGLKSPIGLGEKKISCRIVLFSVILSILHENVFQSHKIHTKIPIKNVRLCHCMQSIIE